jgi:hypothetical protein
MQVPLIDASGSVYEAALQYAEAGFYVLPIKPGVKHPGSVVGEDWETQSSRDPQQLAEWFKGGAKAKRGIVIHVGRSGCVAFDVDEPDRLLDSIKQAITNEEPPFQSTRTNVNGKGHYLFRVPDGRQIGNRLGALAGGWGEIRGKNGVIVVAPSLHEKAEDGGQYEWLQTGTVPELPKAVADLLPDVDAYEESATPHQVETFLSSHNGYDDPGRLIPVLQDFHTKVAAGESRHQSLVHGICWAMREAREGVYPARTAADQLLNAFRDSIGGERDADKEFNECLAWAIAQAQKVERTRAGIILPNLPDDFWEARPMLTHIRKAAHSRKSSADLAFYSVLTRIAAMKSPYITVDTGIGGSNASLNFFAGVVAGSGEGKSTGYGVAKRVMVSTDPNGPLNFLDMKEDLQIGSGEGIAEAYMGKKQVPTGQLDSNGKPKTALRRTQVRHNALFYVDEGETLTKMQTRNGATIGPVLRSAWMGQKIGQQNGNEETTREVDDYSLGLIIGFQLDTVLGTLNEFGTGMAQRFMWCGVRDPSIPRRVEWPGRLPIDLSALMTSEPITMSVSPAIIDELEADRLDRARYGVVKGEEHSSHKPLMLIKVSGLLALLDGRHKITDEDWTLAKVVWETSSKVRDALMAYGRQKQSEEAEAKDRAWVNRQVKAAQGIADASSEVETKVLTVAKNVARRVHDDPSKKWTRSGVTRPLNPKLREFGERGIKHAEDMGWIITDRNFVKPGSSRPST